MTRTAAVLLLIGALARAHEWQLGLSDWARYERRTVTIKAGKESFSKGSIASVHGHDIRDRGQFLPASPKRQDLPMILGFFLPNGADAKRRILLRDIVGVRFRGAFEIKGDRLAGEWAFKSYGKQRKSDAYKILAGTAHVTARFDAQRGIFDWARVELKYTMKKLDPKKGEKPKQVDATYDLRIQSLQVHAYKGFSKDVNAAIDKGVKHLRTLQKEDGSYKPHGKWPVGSTALAVLTLAACDVPLKDPAIERGLAYMLTQDPQRTYAMAISLMAFERAYTPPGELARARRKAVEIKRDLPPDRIAWCKRIATRLERISRLPGAWQYKIHNGRYILYPDASNTQYGILGLRAAARLGIAIKEQTWLGAIRYFEQVREKNGKRASVTLLRHGQALSEAETFGVKEAAGFRYRVTHKAAWGSMTCAGIASLTIARHQLRNTPRFKTIDRKVEEMVLGGWAWLDRNWGLDRNPHKGGNSWYYYYLYSLERAGELMRVKRVGGRDWYFEGAVQLLARQDAKEGYWGKKKEHIAETCFALLFLKRATAPLSGSR